MSYAVLPTLRTPRLSLRPLTQDDADAIVDGVGNFDVSKWLGVVPYPYTHSDAHSFIQDVSDNAKSVWGICDDAGLVGTVSLENQLGYWLARRAWRKGYGFEAAFAATAHWFAHPKNADLYSNYFFGNQRSLAVMRAVGFKDHSQRTTFAKALNQEVTSFVMVLSRSVWEQRMAYSVETERLKIRPMVEKDAPFLVRIATPEVARMLFAVSPGWNEAEACEFIAARQWTGMPGFFATVEAAGEAVGYVGCGGDPLSVMYAFHPDHWGKGYATEAMKAFLHDLFERFPVNQLSAGVFTDNPASSAVLTKLGFVETGRELGSSRGRVEPAPLITYAITRDKVMGTP